MNRAQWFVVSCALALVLACGDSNSPSTPTPTSVPIPDDEVVIVTNTQAHLDGVGVGAGNFWEGEYALPDGTKRTGLSAGLWFGGQHVRVGPGSVVTIGQAEWEVVAVELVEDGQNYVRLKRVP